jgi:hypothetical protein
MDENVGHEATFERKLASVDDGMAFIQDQITGLHGDIVCESIMSNDFQWPRLVDILIDIDNSRANQGISIDMWSKHSAFGL